VSAGHARVHGGGLGNHPLDGKVRLHARQAGLAHPAALFVVGEDGQNRLRHRRMVARRHEPPGFAVLDDFGNAAGPRRRWPKRRPCVEQRRAEALVTES
jgi:hypothetical protein